MKQKPKARNLVLVGLAVALVIELAGVAIVKLGHEGLVILITVIVIMALLKIKI